MNNRSRSTLFLIEQLIVIAVFALCAAACVTILSAAYFDAVDSRDLGNALHAAESCAAAFKATGGDYAETARILGGAADTRVGSEMAVVYYDANWAACDKSGAGYALALKSADAPDGGDGLAFADISIVKLSGAVKTPGEDIVSFTVAARRNAG